VTPSEINAHVGRGDYAAKYISFLRGRHGFEFSVQKDGRTVVSYTLVSEPKDSKLIRDLAVAAKSTKVAKPKAAKAAKPKASKPVKVRQSKQTASAPVKKAARNVLKEKADREADALLAEIGMKNAGEYAGGTYSVDPEWDSMDGIDVANFLK
jgi:preprotein translocase subunit SecF